MEFYQHTTVYHALKSQGVIEPKIPWEQFYIENTKFLTRINGHGAAGDFFMESLWLNDKCPYYLVYPSIVPMLTKLDLNKVPAQNVQPQHKTMHLRFPKGDKNPIQFDLNGNTACLHGVMWYYIEDPDKQKAPFLSLWFDFGESYNVKLQGVVCPNFWSKATWQAAQVPGLNSILSSGKSLKEAYVLAASTPLHFAFNTFVFRNFRLVPDRSVQDNIGEIMILDSLNRGWSIPSEILEKCVKLAITTIMVDQGDTFLLEPDILRDDEPSDRELTPEEWAKYQSKAIRRGKYGFHLGRQYEEALARRKPGTPFVVPPHPCHFHVGKGRTRTIIKTRSGWFANRKAAEQVPTGYGDEELQPVEEGEEDTTPAAVYDPSAYH